MSFFEWRNPKTGHPRRQKQLFRKFSGTSSRISERGLANSKPTTRKQTTNLMNTLIQTSIKRRHRDLLIALALCCAALSSAALAGSPTTVVGEDRGKNNSAAEGIETLNIDTTGQNNTAHGWYSLSANTEGSDNTANGFQALLITLLAATTRPLGLARLVRTPPATDNTANGFEALRHNTDRHQQHRHRFSSAPQQHHRLLQHGQWFFGALCQHHRL